MRDGATTTYSYDARDQLRSESGAAGSATYGYDPAGRMVSKATSTGTTIYGWEDGDRMKSVSGPGVSAQYEYDADGRRVKESAGGQEREFLIDRLLPYGQVIAETDGSGSLAALYTFGQDRVSQDRGGEVRFFMVDGQGSIRQLVDETGQVRDSHVYSAFGEDIYSAGTTIHDFKYVGEQEDPGSGFYYLRARFMDPATGRFISSDPYQGATSLLGLNRYLYADANPVWKTDPMGLFGLSEALTAIILIGIEAARARPAGHPFQVYKSSEQNFAVVQLTGGINADGGVDGTLYWVKSRWKEIYRTSLDMFVKFGKKDMVDAPVSVFTGGDDDPIPANYGTGNDYSVTLKTLKNEMSFHYNPDGSIDSDPIGEGIQRIPNLTMFQRWGSMRARINGIPGGAWYFHDPEDGNRATHGCIGTPKSYMEKLYDYASGRRGQLFHVIVSKKSTGIGNMK